MAAGSIPSPGTALGPCVGECEHIDCAESRRMVSASCRICDEPIGYGRQFYVRLDLAEYVHRACLEAECEAQRATEQRLRREHV